MGRLHGRQIGIVINGFFHILDGDGADYNGLSYFLKRDGMSTFCQIITERFQIVTGGISCRRSHPCRGFIFGRSKFIAVFIGIKSAAGTFSVLIGILPFCHHGNIAGFLKRIGTIKQNSAFNGGRFADFFAISHIVALGFGHLFAAVCQINVFAIGILLELKTRGCDGFSVFGNQLSITKRIGHGFAALIHMGFESLYIHGGTGHAIYII